LPHNTPQTQPLCPASFQGAGLWGEQKPKTEKENTHESLSNLHTFGAGIFRCGEQFRPRNGNRLGKDRRKVIVLVYLKPFKVGRCPELK
jgi:hypothetical protein